MLQDDKWLNANSMKVSLEEKLKYLRATSIQVVLEDIEGEPYLTLESDSRITVQMKPLETLEVWESLSSGCQIEEIWKSVVCLEVLETTTSYQLVKQLFNQNTVY